MTTWLLKQKERKQRNRRLAFTLWYSKGYEQGAAEMKQYLSEQIIYALNKDGVLTMSIDTENLERVVKIIEAVRDIGKAQS
jgi:hypothetical protein